MESHAYLQKRHEALTRCYVTSHWHAEWVNKRNTPIQEKTGSYMEARPKGPSALPAPGGKNKWLSKKVSRRSK